MKIYKFSGSHREVGRAHGEELRESVRESLEQRMALCLKASRLAGGEMNQAAVRALARGCMEHLYEFSPGLFEESEGIAEAAGVSPEDVLIISGYTDLKDLVVAESGETGCGCTACWAGPGATLEGTAFVAQTWDMFTEAERGAVWMHLKVDEEPEVFGLSYAGCIGMMGMNGMGVAVAANNLNPTDAVRGVPWAFLCRAVLACDDAEKGAGELERARLCSGHHFLISDPSGVGISVETTGRRLARIHIAESTYAHTNHYLDSDLKTVERSPDPMGCSPQRLERMDAILRERRGSIDRLCLEQALRDHEGKPRSICSHDYELSGGVKIRSCAALVMNTARREVAYITGNPCGGDFSLFTLGN